MKLTRNLTTKIHFVLDQILPPIIRDSKIFMYLPFRIMFGKKFAKIFFDFKKRAPFMDEEEFGKIYASIDKVLVDRETDLNDACMKEILKNISGTSVLEVGCGKALLSKKLANSGYEVAAVDLQVEDVEDIEKSKSRKLTFMNENAEHLSFKDKKFDTVICTHTLEHVQNLSKSIAELKRVAKKRLIIVVPKQRPYKFTFDLHLHFFPYIHSFLLALKPKKDKYVCKIVGGDIFYIEDF